MEDVRIDAAIKMNFYRQSEVDYYASRIKELAVLKVIDIPSAMMNDVINGVQTKFCNDDHQIFSKYKVQHYMSCSPERLKRYQKCKAIMKRPPSLAPPESHIYRNRKNMRQRQLERRTVINQKVDETYKYLQNDPAHLKYIYNIKKKKMNLTENYERQLSMRLLAASIVCGWIDDIVFGEVKRAEDRKRVAFERDILMEKAAVIISKYYRRHVVLKVKRKRIEELRLQEEAEAKICREKERKFLERMKIRMSLLNI